jgi:hypothetical protein
VADELAAEAEPEGVEPAAAGTLEPVTSEGNPESSANEGRTGVDSKVSDKLSIMAATRCNFISIQHSLWLSMCPG